MAVTPQPVLGHPHPRRHGCLPWVMPAGGRPRAPSPEKAWLPAVGDAGGGPPGGLAVLLSLFLPFSTLPVSCLGLCSTCPFCFPSFSFSPYAPTSQQAFLDPRKLKGERTRDNREHSSFTILINYYCCLELHLICTTSPLRG